MLETFADQIVIALELTRLFEELAQRIHELRGLSDVSRAVSSTLDLEAVLPTIVEHAVQLSGADGGAIYELDESTGEFRLRSTSASQPGLTEKLADAPIGRGEGAVGRAAQERAAVQIVDIAEAGSYAGRLREELIAAGMRSLLAVPLLVENRVIGGLVVARRQPGLFPPAVNELLQTFAGQSALAIQNARLYLDLKLASSHKSIFIAHMSHELRTPLNAIIGFTKNILDDIYGEVPEELLEHLQRVHSSGQHLHALIEDIFLFAQVELGSIKLALADYTWGDLWQMVYAMTESKAAAKGLCLSAVLQPDLPSSRGDELRLRQVLINLVDNAIKFTDGGEVRVDIGVEGDEFRIAVQDTGPGIPGSELQKVFDEFYQVDRSSTRRKGGGGLGLAIARRLVELHGGRIWVESIQGEGATFRLVLPIVAGAEETCREQSEDPPG
jgi:signal transduction histidine kinase